MTKNWSWRQEPLMACTLALIFLWLATPARADDKNEAKGLFREQATSAAALQNAYPESSVKLGGTVEKNFPSPDDVFDIEPEHQPSEASNKLQAIIRKTDYSASAYDRFMKQAYDALVQGYLAEAEKQYVNAIRELKKTGIKDLRLAKARNAVANVSLRDGDLLDARQTFELALKTAKENPGPNLEEAKALAGLGCVAKAAGDYKKAETNLKESIRVRQKLVGEYDSGIAQNLLDLGEVYRLQKLYSEGEPVYQLALETLNKSREVPDLTKAYFLDRTGMFFHDQAKMPEAQKCFAMALDIKDKYSILYAPTDGRKRGLVYYRCENGIPNAARVFTRNAEIEYLHIKDAVAVATLTAQIFGSDWYLLKSEVTITNQGKTAISACTEPPTLAIELPKKKVFSPLDSDAIASQLGLRGRLLYSRLLHSADFAYNISSFNIGATSTAAFTPFGAGLFNTVGAWTTITPDWAARAEARNAALSALSGAQSAANTVFSTRPKPITIGPGESATFQSFFPYEKFSSCTLRFLVGNTVMEFPFTEKSG
jgi:tetratricopeptide (TPR) repeat protein